MSASSEAKKADPIHAPSAPSIKAAAIPLPSLIPPAPKTGIPLAASTT